MPYTAINLVDLKGRLIGMQNAGTPGVWATSIPAGADADKRRNDTENEKAILSADFQVCYRLALLEGHGYRSRFLAVVTGLAHGAKLPERVGPPTQVMVKHAAADADYKAGKTDEALTLGDIERWRANVGGVYGALVHNAANSPLAGFYKVAGDHIFFTGHLAQVEVANVTRTAACQAPQAFEDLVMGMAFLMTRKEGDRLDIAGLVQNYVASGWAMVEGGAMTLPPLQLEQERAA